MKYVFIISFFLMMFIRLEALVLSDTLSLSKNGVINRLGLSDDKEQLNLNITHPFRSNTGIPFSIDANAGIALGRFFTRGWFSYQFTINNYRNFSLKAELFYKLTFRRKEEKQDDSDIMLDDSESKDAYQYTLRLGPVVGFRKHFLWTPLDSYRLQQYQTGVNLEFTDNKFIFSFSFNKFSYSSSASELKYFLENNQFILFLINAEQAVSEIYSFPDFTLSFNFAYQLTAHLRVLAGFQMSWLMVSTTELNTRYLGVDVTLGKITLSLTYMNSYFEGYFHSMLFGFKINL